MKILFLDDNPKRTKKFRSKFPMAYTVETSAECIDMLKGDHEWDSVWLDHDLGGETFVDSFREDTGMEVVRWIVENKPTIAEIVVHSHNYRAAEIMMKLLREAEYTIRRIPFIRFVESLNKL